MDDRNYVAFLIRADKNLVSFATFTHYTKSVDGRLELRAASALPSAHFQKVLELLDREPIRITDWPSLYRWLGREFGTWATFSEELLEEFVPHWFSSEAECLCKSLSSDGNGPFLDVRYGDLPTDDIDRFRDMTGSVDSEDGLAYVCNIYSNLVLTKRPIFPVQIAEES